MPEPEEAAALVMRPSVTNLGVILAALWKNSASEEDGAEFPMEMLLKTQWNSYYTYWWQKPEGKEASKYYAVYLELGR